MYFAKFWKQQVLSAPLSVREDYCICSRQQLAQGWNLRQRNGLGRSLGYKGHALRLGVMPALDDPISDMGRW